MKKPPPKPEPITAASLGIRTTTRPVLVYNTLGGSRWIPMSLPALKCLEAPQ